MADEREALFQRWLRDHLGLIMKIVRGCTSSAHDQDDLLQDVLTNLWSSIPAFRGDAKETTWIYRVSFNTALAWRRGEHRRKRRAFAFLKRAVPNGAPTIAPQEIDSKSPIEHLYDAIRELSKVDASLAIMHLDGLSYQEMADVVGISENYVGVKLNRIRKQLADRLKGVFDDV